jgi:hypothetical protein
MARGKEIGLPSLSLFDEPNALRASRSGFFVFDADQIFSVILKHLREVYCEYGIS